MRFSYCPVCGKKLGMRVCGDEGEVPFCDRCDRPWFDMFAAASIILVINGEGKVALLDQSYLSTKYKNLVSGYIKPGESAEECALREVAEEIGIHLKSLELQVTRWFTKAQVLMVGFIGRTDDTALSLSGEVDAAGWFTPEEAIKLVHPKETGAVSGLLVDLYLTQKQSIENGGIPNG